MKIERLDIIDGVNRTDKDGGLFNSSAWLSCFGNRANRYVVRAKDGQVIGGFIGFHGGRAGIRTLITPPYTPHIGLYLNLDSQGQAKTNTHRKEVMSALADFLGSGGFHYYKIDLDTSWRDVQPLTWAGIRTQPRYTYHLDLDIEENVIREGLDSRTRNMVNRGEREELEVTHEPEIKRGMEMIRVNLERNGVTVHEDILERILHLSSDDKNGIWTIVKKAEQVAALNVCVCDDKRVYNLLSVVNRDQKDNFSGAYCLYNSIIEARRRGYSLFDFEGSGIPEIEKFFRSFGGDIQPYFCVTGGKWPWKQLMELRQKKGPL